MAEAYLAQSPVAFAVVRGKRRELVYYNAPFALMTGISADEKLGTPIEELFDEACRTEVRTLIDAAMRAEAPARDHLVCSPPDGRAPWSWAAWPMIYGGLRIEDVIVEIRTGTDAEVTLSLQKQVAERMLISALRATDQAEKSEASGARAVALSDASQSLTMSLDEAAALAAVAALRLPGPGSWCIVDIIEVDGSMCRQPIVHPDPERASLAAKLTAWAPETHDPFGLPAVVDRSHPVMLEHADNFLAAAAHTPRNLVILRQLGIGSVLTVPLVSRAHVLGAITFVSGRTRGAFTSDDVQHATDLATRSAMALDSARSYGQAILLRAKADIANEMKTAFLGAMSHELRTPLNAIGGFVDLIDMGLRGTVTEEQHADLARIRANQQHLLGLINEILNFVKVGGGHVSYDIVDVPAKELLAHAVALVQPLFAQNGLDYRGIACVGTPVVQADVDKVHQILVNLLSNAIKFTPSGGRISLACTQSGDVGKLTVSDSGIGIPADKLLPIFEPFVQIKNNLAGRTSGVGLGLAISRDLARAMHGDLSAASDGNGSTFTLSLPAASRLT